MHGKIDIDECLSKDSCGPNSICSNTMGSFSCQCEPGYTLNGSFCMGEYIQIRKFGLNLSRLNTLANFLEIKACIVYHPLWLVDFISLHGVQNPVVLHCRH